MSSAVATSTPATVDARPTHPWRLAHLTTSDMSLALLLETELRADVEAGLTVFGLSAPGPWVERIERLGVEHVPVPALTRAWSPGEDFRAARQLARVLHRLDLDVLHTHNPKTGVLGRILGRAAGIPVVVNTCHGLWATPDDPPLRRAAVYAIEAVAARFSDAELYQNEQDEHTMRRLGAGRRGHVVGNGVDLERFRPDPPAGRALREELGIAPDEVLVVGVGRVVAEKGVAEFAAAATALQDRATFVWVGPSDDDKPDAVAFDTAGPVRHVGARDDMEAVYAACDVFVLPSHREGLSRSAMEAAATGCALVLTDIRGCRELGAGGREALFVPPRAAGAVTSAVARLAGDARLRARLGDAARARAIATFDQRRVAGTSLATYAAVRRRKGRPW